MANKRRILVIYPFSSSYIQRDMEILKEEFQVMPFQYKGKKDIFRMLRSILKTDVNISWFTLGNATMALHLSGILRKKTIVIAGGWDVVSMPEIGYGAMRGKRIKKTRYALKKANKVIAVSESTKEWVLKWVDRDDVITLYHGFDPQTFLPKGEKEKMVVTVGKLENEVTIAIKGLDTFLKTAKLLPDVKFVMIGRHDPKLAKEWRAKAPPNLEILDFIPYDKIRGYYQMAKVYTQLSYQESFGCALAEAMLCECVPVVTRRGGIPEVVGDAGFYVKYGDAKATAEKIKEALNSDIGGDARKRIMTLFPLNERKKRLTKIVYDCMK
ncbi:MAG: glycosyltransferase [Thermoplasmata archaeon]|nr:MAG: glycosyltransferase [Thermoplasmata archaeon]